MGPNRVTFIAALLLPFALLAMAGCGDGEGNGDLNPSGYLSVEERRILFVEWDQLEGELSGTIYHVERGGPGEVLPISSPFTAARDGDQLAFFIEEERIGFPARMRAGLAEEKLTIYVPAGGIVVPIALLPGTSDEYNAAIEEMRNRPTAMPDEDGVEPLTPTP